MATKAKNLVGLCTCPECGFDEAEVKTTKAAFSYRWCPECSAQYFPRCESTSKRLIAKCHTLAEVVGTVEENRPALAPAAMPVTVEVEPVPVPVPKTRAGPFDFILHKQRKEGVSA